MAALVWALMGPPGLGPNGPLHWVLEGPLPWALQGPFPWALEGPLPWALWGPLQILNKAYIYTYIPSRV